MSIFGNLLAAIRTMLRRALGGSDKARWSSTENLHQSWDARTRALAEWITTGSSVLEFGAGRRTLETFLPQGARYTPSDIVDRGPGTIVCDLNDASLPTFQMHDVVVFSGVLEYVNDVPRLIRHLRPLCRTIVASYAQSDVGGTPPLLLRRRQGWVNDYTIEQLIAVFAAEGFRCEQSLPKGNQRLFKFVREG